MKDSYQANKVNTAQQTPRPSCRTGDSPLSMDTCHTGIDALVAGLCLSGEQAAELDKTLIDTSESSALLKEMLRVTRSRAVL